MWDQVNRVVEDELANVDGGGYQDHMLCVRAFEPRVVRVEVSEGSKKQLGRSKAAEDNLVQK